MPRYREPFTLFPRKLKSGKSVYYYRTYSPDGERTVAHSTGLTNKTLARNYCADLLSKGLLYSNAGMCFGVYANGFFDDDSQWMADKIQSGQGKAQPVAKNTLKSYRHSLDTFILPFFKNIKLIDIKPSHIKKFRDSLISQSFSNSVINLNCTILKIIISYARADGLVVIDPFVSVPTMYVNARTKNAFTVEQLKKAFNKDWKNSERKTFSLIAAVAGLRISEIYAIRKETLHEDYIDVRDQINDNTLCPVKDGEKRKVRICKELYVMISKCIKRNGDYAFKEAQDTYRRVFYDFAELDLDKRKKTNLTFHSLRHFINTYMINHGIPEIKVKCILGHSSGKGSMTERYANFQPSDFDDFAELQSELLKTFLDSY